MYGAKVITVHKTGNVDVVYDTAGEDEEKGVHGEWLGAPTRGTVDGSATDMAGSLARLKANLT